MIEYLDLFKQPLYMFINQNQWRTGSRFGGSVTIITICYMVYVGFYSAQNLLSNESDTIR